jgi:beta-glucosidase
MQVSWLLRMAAIASLVSAPALPAEVGVSFDWFEYRGHDEMFEQPLRAGQFRNPILSGFHSDPSITRAGDKFYLVNSTFTYFPAIPVYESRDLVHWRQVGNVVDRPSQLNFDGLGVSRGVFAPSIEYHEGTFYVLSTAIDSGGNFVSTARDPAGPWSDPVGLPIDGIDPALFIDTDGRAYVLNNGPPEGNRRYEGHRAIWIQAFDLAERRLTGPRRVLVDGGVDPARQPIWIEGPHIYKVGDWYYLSCAEGGTGPDHSQVVFRSTSVFGPYEPYAGNPILTQRDLPAGRSTSITNAGHADLVEAGDGGWWAVFLASRTYGDGQYNTGRETFLLPVTWKEGWPTILERGKAIPTIVDAPRFARGQTQAPLSGNFVWRDEFDAEALRPDWLQLRVPRQTWTDLRKKRGSLTIEPSAAPLDGYLNPSFLARRQQHLSFDATTQLEPPAEGVDAGLATLQSEQYWFFLGARRSGRQLTVFLERRRAGAVATTVASATVSVPLKLRLRIDGAGADYTFRYAADDGAWSVLREHEDGTLLSTKVAGGFVGAVLGPYARAARSDATPLYRDLNQSFEARAADLVSRMTLEEKISQLGNDAPAIPRLDVPAYEWWNEGLHGVARAGSATVFPQAIGLAATFDTALMREVATAISDEARAKHHEFVRREQRGRYRGLTFWSPNINIFRDPRWGRGQETYGEDPYLTARLGVEFVRGMQGNDAKYRKVDATAKHYAVHSGPEADRHRFDVQPTKRDLYETYLPAFRALVQEARVAAVMGAYNRVYGESASASPFLLQDTLRKRWGFDGYVVSDCDSIEDIFLHHKIVSTAPEAAALAVRNGCNLDCGKTYEALLPAVRQGLIEEGAIDAALTSLMSARFRLGMFDPPERVPWAGIPYAVNQSQQHDELARRAARESIVLLKNDGILPLRRDVGTVAVVGPTADEIMSLLGNYYGTPAAPVTILQGIRAAVGPATRILHARGADLVEGREEPRAAPLIESTYLRPAAGSREHGLKGEYFRGRAFEGNPVLVRVDSQVAFRWDRGSPTDDLVARGELAAANALAGDDFSVRWTGKLVPPVTGRYEISVGANDGFRLFLDGREIISQWELTPRVLSRTASVQLTAGREHDLRLEYFEDIRDAEIRLAWRRPGAKAPLDEAIEAARAADVVVFAGGLTGDVEGEEMTVNYPGFSGGDRTDLRLPAPQHRLLEAMHATGKPVILVLTTGSALAVDWAKAHVPAILVAWYPGQRGGAAVADVLFGDANPSGRLPVTFYKAEERLPAFDDYHMSGRTYRYFEGEPLYAFGHGLSYTTFRYSQVTLDRSAGKPDETAYASVEITNTGSKPGSEVVQMYLRAEEPRRARPVRELRGIRKVTLQAGETQRVAFALKPDRDLTYYDEKADRYDVDPGRYEVAIGASSMDIRTRAPYVVTR